MKEKQNIRIELKIEESKMNNNKFVILNCISGISFVISSISLLAVPFLDISQGLTIIAYAVAIAFWIGLSIGMGIQIFLFIVCKKRNIKSQEKSSKWFYIISGVAWLTFTILSVLRIDYTVLISLLLFVAIVTLELAVVIKRGRCLK